MKILIAFSTFFLLTTGIKAKRCIDTDGRVYRIGQGYETNCTQFTCQEGGPKLEMVASPSIYCCWENGQEYSIGEIVSTQHIEKVKKCESVEGKATMMDENFYGKFCVFEDQVIPLGEWLPLPKMCSWMSCSYTSINQTKMPSLSIEGVSNPPGFGCCLEDGIMHREGGNITLESGLEFTCNKGDWEALCVNTNISLLWIGAGSGSMMTLNLPDFSPIDSKSEVFIQYPFGKGLAGSESYNQHQMIEGKLYVCSHKVCTRYNDEAWDTKMRNAESWDTIDDVKFKPKRSWAASTVIGSQWFITGGDIEVNGKWTPVATTEVWSPGKGNWEESSEHKSPLPVDGHCVVTLQGKIMQIGGSRSVKSGAGDTNRCFLGEREISSLKASRMYHTCAVLQQKVYVAGGDVSRSRGKHGSVEIYDPVSGKWSDGPDLPLTERDRHSRLVVVEDEMHYIGSSIGKIFRLRNNKWEYVRDIDKRGKHVAVVIKKERCV